MCVQRNYFPVSRAKARDIQGAHYATLRHLLAISLGHKTDFQQNTWTLPPSRLLFFFFTLSLFQSLPRSPALLFPSHLSLSPSFSTSLCLPYHPSSFPPSPLAPFPPSLSKVAHGLCLREVQFPPALDGRGRMPESCRQTHMFEP